MVCISSSYSVIVQVRVVCDTPDSNNDLEYVFHKNNCNAVLLDETC